MKTFDLDGKVAIVTGSNTGLGAGMAIALAAAGCDIVGVSRAGAGDTPARVEATGRRFADVRADLASTAPVDDIVRAVNQVGAAPGDIVAILEALKEAGALRAELIVI